MPGVTVNYHFLKVEKINLAFFYQFGGQLGRVARALVSETTVSPAEHHQLWTDAWFARSQAEQLLAAPWNMRVARTAVADFGAAVDRYGLALYPAQTQTTEQPSLPLDPMSSRTQVILRAIELQTILQAEWGTWAAYFVPQQGIYQTDDLIDRADYTLPTETRVRIDDEVASDIREAGRCLAFGVPTASGFHMMRAVESVIWRYCATVEIEGDKKPPKSANWGVYTGYLSKSLDPHVKEILALLQQLKDNQRNLIMHPEKVLTASDAFRLFEVGQSAIIAMADRLPAVENDDLAAPPS